MRDGYSAASDAAGYLIWAVIVAGFTAPVWLPILAWVAGLSLRG